MKSIIPPITDVERMSAELRPLSPQPATLEPGTVSGLECGTVSVSHRWGDAIIGELPGKRGGKRGGIVLSLFSGIGLLDLAFKRAGFTVVSAGDLIFGSDIRDVNPPPGLIWGVIGGPPCQQFSRANRQAAPRDEAGDGYQMLSEFRRVVGSARPEWWLAENVECVPDLVIDGYCWQRTPVELTWFVPVRRRRHIQFGSRSGTLIDLTPPRPVPVWPVGSVAECVIGGRRDGRDWRAKAQLMGLPAEWDVPCLTRESLAHAIGNGVPLPLGEFLAAAVAEAYGDAADGSSIRSEITRCACPCRRPVSGRRRRYFNTNCRKIAQMRRDRAARSAR